MICTDNVELTKTTLGQFCEDNDVEEPGGDMSFEGYSVKTVGTLTGNGNIIRFPVDRKPYFIPADHYERYIESPALNQQIYKGRNAKSLITLNTQNCLL
jgi:hypothetical protein